ncbi:MAG: hypothetical protein IT329_15400 [Caldilineaceae bacterium]|nr:hypothetical protein [Caldilineaceae bacterium]
MAEDRDHYAVYYADKLWGLLPAVYRAEDSAVIDRPGPLRELVNRMGVQAAILRRSIDRLWEDQSIESCDDWLIPYMADLLATNLVSGLDSRGQRLDVAKTIYYRRRKGTVALLEELAADITGWEVRVVEFFRRLARTRHGLDPAIGLPAASADPLGARTLQLAQGLVGPFTETVLGGMADLRHAYGAACVQTAFDEFHHTVDVRRGQEQVGWHNIPRLGVFLWRLYSFGLDQTTPVPVKDCPGRYAFDPTGRELPLFARAARTRDNYGDRWVSPQAWQLPDAISTLLLDTFPAELVPASLNVLHLQGSFFDPVPLTQVTIYPEVGRLTLDAALQGDTIRVTYHYGFASTLGAGPYDRRLLGLQAPDLPQPETSVNDGGGALVAPLGSLAPTGTLTIADSLTYDQVADIGVGGSAIQNVTVRGENMRRPVIRLDPGTLWTFAGNAGRLHLEGLLISGGDLLLQGDYDEVRLTCCTLDPGSAGDRLTPPTLFAQAVDGRDLTPTRLWVEGHVDRLVLDRCIAGPIRVRGRGVIEELVASDSIVQGIRSAELVPFVLADFKDPIGLAVRLRDRPDPVSAFLFGQFAPATTVLLAAYDDQERTAPPDAATQQAILQEFNAVMAGPALYDPARFSLVALSPAVQARIAQAPTGAALAQLNRLLLEEAYPTELADLAFALNSGVAQLTRCTVLGRAYLHRLEASECILDDVTLVEDVQQGCVRFSAWASGSHLPSPYESVEVPARGPLFAARTFGRPDYALLRLTADAAILGGAVGATLREGAQNGSEMGAFNREQAAIKVRSLRIKLDEYMPLGLAPVIVHVT